MSKLMTLTEIAEEGFVVGDKFKCIDDKGCGGVYNRGEVYEVIDGRMGIGLNDEYGEHSICTNGSVIFEKVNNLDTPKVSREELFYIELNCENVQLTREEAKQLYNELAKALCEGK